MTESGLAISRIVSSQGKFVSTNYLQPKGFSWLYLRYRVFRPILKIYRSWLLRKWKEPIPWLTPASIDILDQVLTKNMRMLEYGSGSSTLFFAARVGELISVEHHAEWYRQVSDWLQSAGTTHVDYHLIEGDGIESNADIEERNQQPYQQDNPRYADYVHFLTTFPDHHFDVILIDGRARTECSLAAMHKLKSGGIFILDNSERPRYRRVHDVLESWKKITTTSGLTDTTFWFKP